MIICGNCGEVFRRVHWNNRGKDTFITTLQNNIATVFSKENDKTITDIDNRLEELQTQLLKLANS